jgi:tetratricopeptide (TPR) repeat protein
MASVYARLGDVDRARALVAEADRNLPRNDGRRMLAKAARAAGDLEEAEEHARAVLDDLTRAGRGSYRSLAAGELAVILVERGELEEAERAVEIAVEDDADALNSAVAWRLALAGVRARQGRHEEALRLVSEVLYRLEPTDHEPHRADCLLVSAEVAELAGRRDEARRHAAEALAVARAKEYRVLVPRIEAMLERLAG